MGKERKKKVGESLKTYKNHILVLIFPFYFLLFFLNSCMLDLALAMEPFQ